MKEFPGITSVLIPLFNHEQFIAATLNSLLESDCTKIELIVCDDASADQSLAVAKDWIDRHGARFFSTRLLSNTKNMGITSNLNKTDRSIIRGIHYNAGLRRHADPRSDRHTAQLPDQSSRCRFCFRQLRNNEYRSANH